MTKVLITGGAGFIGSHLVDYHVEKNRYFLITTIKRLLIKIIILINFAYFLLSEILGFLNVLEKMVLKWTKY